ncbi:hypothetical protein VPH35_047578 [Triticum aestivum]
MSGIGSEGWHLCRNHLIYYPSYDRARPYSSHGLREERKGSRLIRDVLKRRIFSGLQNFDRSNVASIVMAADKGLEAPPNIIMSEMGSQAPAYKAYMGTDFSNPMGTINYEEMHSVASLGFTLLPSQELGFVACHATQASSDIQQYV